jgi:phosphonate transport system substrate-binding protein
MGDMAVFGFVAEGGSEAARERMVTFSVKLAKLTGLEVVTCRAHNYTELAALVHQDKIDFAWLPPIPYLALVRHGRVIPLASARREGRAEFYCVLVVRADGAITNPRHLVGKRAAWVDPHSASGYVLPRIALAAVGVDPRTAFRTEKFYEAHEAVLRAVLDDAADFAATFAWLDREGNVARGAWLDVASSGTDKGLRVLATFGAIPADVVAARTELDGALRERLTTALLGVEADAPGFLKEVFGVDELRRGPSPGYAEFGEAVMRASESGLLEGEEKS